MFREVVKRAVVTFAAVFIVSLGAMSFAGCSVFAPQQTVASLCTRITEQNAGVICVKAGYSAIREAAIVVQRRYEEKRISLSAARDSLAALEKANTAVSFAELAVLAGEFGTAQGQMDTAINVLTAIEGRLQ